MSNTEHSHTQAEWDALVHATRVQPEGAALKVLDLERELGEARRQLEGAVSAARTELLAEVTQALRSEGYIYRSYGPRAADFIDQRFGGSSR